MQNVSSDERVEILAHSPGSYPILVVELPSGELRVAYFETDYDLGRAKPVERAWVRENAVGRHSFVELDPPAEVTAGSLGAYVRRELLREP